VLNLHAKPKAGFTVAPQKPIERIDELQFTNTSSGDNIVSYKWYFDDLSESLVKSKNTTRIYEDAGTYVVAMVVENMYACKDTMTRPLVIASDFALYVPNTFTPNDDNFNDVFLPVARAIKSYDLKVYDRWGHERFHSKSLESGWDGRFSGELCKQDVYTWVIEVSTNNGDAVKRSGTVTLLR
jgi:gliding motility-associated-like protein